MSKIVFISGVSGSGKGVIMDEILKEENITLVQSYVTRAMRPGEVNGQRYNFISEELFKQMIENGEFLEYEQVHKGGYYGTKLQELLDLLNQGKSPVKEVDMKGLEKIKSEHKIDGKFTSVFFDIPEDVMIKRITGRAPIQQEELNNRLESAKIERELARVLCDHIIITDAPTLEENVQRVKSVLDKELNK